MSAISYADRAGPAFVVREPTCTSWYAMQREVHCLICGDFEGYNDFGDVLAINILVAAMPSEAARVAR
jgi:hypothetical protein